MRKIKIIGTAAMLIKSDVLAVTSDGSFYPSSADMSSTALLYFPHTWRLLLWAMDVGSMRQRIVSIVQVMMQCMTTQALLSPLYFDPVFQLHHLATTLVQEFKSLHDHRFCSSYKQVQKFERSSAIVQGAEFIQFAVVEVDQNPSLLDSHMEWNGW